MVVWLSSKTLVSIKVVTLCQVQLVLGWVTICEWVNYLAM